ncbi:MAG: aconitate hydratase [Clostridiales bacterium]
MGASATEKILLGHLCEGSLEPGEGNGFRADSVLMHDMSGLLACMGLEAMGLERAVIPLPVLFIDHNLISMDSGNPDSQSYLQSCAQRFGMCYSRPGNGICHSLYYHRLGRPGTLLIGADSHSATAGALGMLGIGVGGMDAALVLSGQPFRMKTPSLLEIRLAGSLPAGTCAKDAALILLRLLSAGGCLGKIVEYTGEGVKSLTVPQRATLANMGAEMGATSSVFPSDEQTAHFLAAQSREEDYIPLQADGDARYDETIEFDLSKVTPMVALPGQPDYGRPVAEAGKAAFSQVFIGSCTNGSYTDLARAALIFKGRKVAPGTDVLVSCPTRQIYGMLLRDGYLQMFADAGVRILECGCGPCMGIGQAPASRAVILRTSNRNYSGRSGTPEAHMYLCGTETAAASAVTGCLTAAHELMDVSLLEQVREPASYSIDDSMLLHYEKKPEPVRLRYAPNIRPLPVKEPPGSAISGRVSLKLGDGVSTDDIVPPDPRVLSLRANIPELSTYLFHHIDPEFARRAAELPGSVIVAGEGYAQGSSREHAAIGCMYLGVEAVLAKSIHRIHRANLINYGILPLLFEQAEDYAGIEQGDLLELKDLAAQLRSEKRISIKNLTRNTVFYAISDLSPREIRLLEAGGLIPYMRNKIGKIL